MIENRCIGIFGGTFDPIHYGHLRTALEIQIRLELQQVRFVPCAVPPHREKPLLSSELRLKMVRAAIAPEPAFVADAREIERAGPSYSIDTLTSLRAEYPDTPLGMIVGMDAFLALTSWRDWQRILDLAHIIVARRPGWEAPTEGVLGELLATAATKRTADLHGALAGRIAIAAVTQLEISSTDLRNSISAGIDPRYLVPPSVRDIIIETESYAQTSKGGSEAY
jgi:nicotinate-nucleotide adenylyltransferase